MTELDGQDAFAALSRLLDGQENGDAWQACSPAIERLRCALVNPAQTASALDLAVLLRQVLTHQYMRCGMNVAPTLRVAHPRFSGFMCWDQVGLRARVIEAGILITLFPWKPAWLRETDDGVENFAASEITCREFNSAECEGDPMLSTVGGRTSYRSRGQRAAVRAVLSTPAGGSLVIALPTGEGKSMIFQLIHTVGFVGAHQSETAGVTLVIVPTVALGVNHEQDSVTVCNLSRPLAFQGGNDTENAYIIERIADGTQGLCFASPEAACGSLRHALRHAAEKGLLRALVIDEAHLVDQWGTGFRTEFQELSGLRREFLTAAPQGQEMRTIMLSATLTDSSLATLRSLFGEESQFESLSAVQLRPEPDYWMAPFTDEASRHSQILEALHHVPRPAVLYVTEVAEAEAWYNRLTDAGFGRVRKLHGKTNRAEREEIVSQWREGALDIVVGTSAFGLGIDYAHARSVLHACLPETLDRFYQEVGRGGRDGKAALSLIVPTKRDIVIAKRVNIQKVISIQRGHQRWRAMFSGKVSLGNGRFAVRIDGRPGNDAHDIDMFGDKNTDWNLRTLAVMARAGMISLLGTPYPRINQEGNWLEVEIIDDHHSEMTCWQKHVKRVRQEVARASKHNFNLMLEFLEDKQCPAMVFGKLYGEKCIGRVCSRCRRCRSDTSRRYPPVPVGEPRSAWCIPLTPLLSDLLGYDYRLLVTYPPDTLERKASRRLGEILRRLQNAGLAKLITLGVQVFDMQRVLEFAKTSPFFVSNLTSLALSRLPYGPELVMVGTGQMLVPQNLTSRPRNPRIFLAPDDQLAPDGRRLKDVFGGRTINFDEFYARVSQ